MAITKKTAGIEASSRRNTIDVVSLWALNALEEFGILAFILVHLSFIEETITYDAIMLRAAKAKRGSIHRQSTGQSAFSEPAAAGHI